jgi:hypothetical protein
MSLDTHPLPGNVPIALGDLYPIEKLAADYSNILTVATLRWQLRHRETNGLAPACVNVGKRLLISKGRYEAWLATQARS